MRNLETPKPPSGLLPFVSGVMSWAGPPSLGDLRRQGAAERIACQRQAVPQIINYVSRRFQFSLFALSK